MSENTLPPEVLTDFSWLKEDASTLFQPGRSPEARLELLRQAAIGVFERRRVLLARELKASQVLELVALIISKTYAGRGDSFQLADDEALVRISDLLLEHAPHIIRRYSHMQITERQLLKQLRVDGLLME